MSLLIGIIIGLVLGLTGAGGSVLAVPLLMAVLGWTMTQAATVSLLAVAIAAAVGAAMAWRHSYVRYRAAALMALTGLLFAPVGIHIADTLPPAQLMMIFAVILAIVAARMGFSSLASSEDAGIVRAAVAGEGHPSAGTIGRVDPATGRLIWTRRVAAMIALIGAVTGFLCGLLGVGGGFVIVPALRAALPLSMHSAVATSLLAIALTSLGTFVSGLLQGREVALELALPFVAGAVIGMVLGRRLAPAISGPRLQQGFAFTAWTVALFMLAHAAAWR